MYNWSNTPDNRNRHHSNRDNRFPPPGGPYASAPWTPQVNPAAYDTNRNEYNAYATQSQWGQQHVGAYEMNSSQQIDHGAQPVQHPRIDYNSQSQPLQQHSHRSQQYWHQRADPASTSQINRPLVDNGRIQRAPQMHPRPMPAYQSQA